MPISSSRRRPASRPASALALLLLAACGGGAGPALVVGGASYSAEQVRGLAPEQLALLADLTSFGLAVAEGRVDSLVAPLVRREADLARLDVLPYALAARGAPAGEQALRAAYERAPEWELRVRHVVRLVPRWASAGQRAEARAVAEEVARRAAAGEDFAALAAEYSEEPGAARRGGLLDPGREGSWVAPFWEAAVALQPGEVSGVVESMYGYHVLKLDGREPVPFDRADRAVLLRRVVSPAAARAAMEEWAGARPAVALDPPAVLATREALLAGTAPDSLVLARPQGGEPFTAADLAVAWAALPPGEREALGTGDDAGFGRWAQREARDAAWAGAAREMGAEASAATVAEARTRWEQAAGRWAEGLGFAPGMTAEQVEAAALGALAGTGQELRIARAEVGALRPLLRGLYAVSGTAIPAGESSSEMR